MHINELGTDVLTCVLSTACQAEQVAYLDEEKAEGLRAALAVCRLWRELMLPYAYRHLRLAYDSLDVENTEVQRIDKGFARYVRTIDISICGLIIESFDIVAYLNDTGVGSDAWPRVTKIHIFNDIKLGKSRKRKEDYKVKPSASTTEAAGDYMRRLFPNITEIKYINVDGRYNNSANLKRTKYLFFQELIHGYSKQLRALNQRVYGRSLPRDLAFPQQLTHLTISMIDYECEVLPKMLAPSLRHLKIADATPDITWNWFSSNDGDDIWFTSLRDLLIEFQRSSFRATYLAHDLPKFSSDYRNAAKQAHFPALESLTMNRNPYNDDSFFRLFEGSPLKRLHCLVPRAINSHIPRYMLADITDLKVLVDYESQIPSEPYLETQPVDVHGIYNNAISRLFSSRSTVRQASITSRIGPFMSLPDPIAWSCVERLELRFFVYMDSIHRILAQMPRLKRLGAYSSIDYQIDPDPVASNGLAQSEANKQARVANKSVQYLSFSLLEASSVEESTLARWLSNILPLVPSLLTLRLHPTLAESAKKIISGLKSSFDWVPEQMEIAKRE